VRLLIEASPGGVVVLVVAIALISGGGGAISAVAVAVIITIAIAIALALGGLVALVVYRLRRASQGASHPLIYRAQLAPNPVERSTGLPAQTRQSLPDSAPALEAPAVRLDPGQLAELANLIRRDVRPE
jgi:hypothetical protein